MKKSLLILFTLFAVSITANAQKFALIDMEYILENIPAYERANEQLEQASRLLPFLKHREVKRKKRLSLKRNQQPNCAANTSVRKANCIKNVKV